MFCAATGATGAGAKSVAGWVADRPDEAGTGGSAVEAFDELEPSDSLKSPNSDIRFLSVPKMPVLLDGPLIAGDET